MFSGFFGTPSVPAALANEPKTLVDALGGDPGDVAHSDTALARASALATGPRAAAFSPLLVRHTSCFGVRWSEAFAILDFGILRLYRSQASKSAFQTYQVKECECTVGEREECKTDFYCFRLEHASGRATFCALNSKQQLLWLQALQAGGVKYEDPPVGGIAGISSLFELRANMLSGEPVELSQYAGCVCLVVNAASK